MKITIDVQPDGGATDVWHRGGVLQFPTEREALEFVARRLADRPSTEVEVRVR